MKTSFALALGALMGTATLACAQEASTAPTVLLASSTNDFARVVRDYGIPDSAQSQRRRGLPRFGVDAGVFFPTSGKTKDAFGSRWTSFGLGTGFTVVTRPGFDPDFEILSQDKGGNDASVYLVGGRFLFPLARPAVTAAIPTFAPYAGVGVNLNYTRIDAPDFGADDKGFGVGGSAILGASIGRRLFAEARYRVFTEKADFNLSGAQLVVGARF